MRTQEYTHTREKFEKAAGLFLKGWQIKRATFYRITMVMETLTVLVFMVALFTVTARCLRLCGGVVLTAVL